MWKNIRILCLLIVLLIVAVQAWRDQNQDWNQPIVVVLHPINTDGLQTKPRKLIFISYKTLTSKRLKAT